MSWKARLAWGGAILALLTVTRFPLAPKHLFYFDSINFALALSDFNPALHQPQPPGYPLFVGLTRLLQAISGQAGPEQLFLAAGILGAAASLLFLWLTADSMFGTGAGLAAAVLFLFHPILWFGGLTNQVRIFQAVCSTGAAFFVWRAWSPHSPSSRVLAAAFWIGFATGFRPTSLILLLPLLLALLWRRNRPQECIPTGVTLAAAVSLWLVPLIWTAGGVSAYHQLLSEYARNQFQDSSLLFGAQPLSAWKMASATFVWNGMGVLTWIWLLPFVDHHRLKDRLHLVLPFLVAWSIPAFLFQAVVHVADPDQTLLTIPVVCLLGASVFRAFAERFPSSAISLRWGAPLALAAGMNVILFLKPLPGQARAASYKVVRFMDVHTASTLRAVRELQTNGPNVLLWCGSIVTWRHLSYYFPENPVLVMEPGASGPDAVWTLRNGKREPASTQHGTVLLPPTSRVVLLASPDATSAAMEKELRAKRHGPLLYLDVQSGLRFRIGKMTFVADYTPSQARLPRVR